MARVSVVIPVYNIAPHLRQCLDSVVGQTLRDIEVICVDDGSTDESPAILEEYKEKDCRVQVITQNNAGPGAARNTGLNRATGEYLIFLDSDDWFEPELLERMVSRAEESAADVTICKAVEFDTNTGKELPSEWMLKTKYLPGDVFAPGDVADWMFQFTYGWPWDKLYRTGFVRETQLRYPPLPNSEDLVFVFQSLAAAGRICVLNKSLVHHRMNRTASVSNSRHRDPEVPYRALAMLKNALMQRGVYAQFERSFLNWAMEFLIWNVANMGGKEAQRRYYKQLRDVWLPEMRFEWHPASYYRDRWTYAKYLLVRYAPYGVFSGIVSAYQRCKRGVGR